MKRALALSALFGGGLTLVMHSWRRRGPGALAPGRMSEIDGEWIHYVETGAGPAVVLIHGFTGSTFTWRDTIPALAATHRVVALDLPGFGFSDRNPGLTYTPEAHARRVVRLMDERGIERATLVGHSMGGGVAERVATAHPERVERLVLVASVDASERPDWEGRPEWMTRVLLLGAGMVFRSPWLARRTVRRVVGAMAPDEYASGEVIDGYLAPLLRPGTVNCVRLLFGQSRGMARCDIGAIQAPTLVITGELDREVPASVGERLAARIPGARHIVQPRSGHLLAEEKPGVFLSELEGFLGTPPD